MTGISFQALPMAQFTTLQKKVFPAYFRLQVGLVVLTALTHPPRSLVSLRGSWGDYIPIAIALGTSALNLLVYGPRTQDVMVERIHQGEWASLSTPAKNPSLTNLAKKLRTKENSTIRKA